MIKNILTAAVVSVTMGASAASAALIDFTSNGTGVTGMVGSATWTLTASPDDIRSNQAPGACPTDCQALGLAMDFDGLGIAGPEVSTTSVGNQYLTLSFDEKVKLSGIAYIDMYKDTPPSPDFETGRVIAGAFVDGATFDHETDAVFVKFKSNGFVYDDTISLTGTVFTIFAGPINDNAGQPDSALAAVVISAVPLPAGVLLMGTALGGLGLARRRKKA